MERRIPLSTPTSAVTYQTSPVGQPANCSYGLPQRLAPVGAHIQGRVDADFLQHNQQTIVAARVAMEDVFADHPPPTHSISQFPPPLCLQGSSSSPKQQSKPEPTSIFQAATTIHLEAASKKLSGKRKDLKVTNKAQSPRLTASPLSRRPSVPTPPEQKTFSAQTCSDLTAQQTFQIKAQVEAYRRLLRGVDIPAEVNIAARGRPPTALRPTCGGIVERGLQEDGFENSKLPFFNPNGIVSFDPRRLPRYPVDHVFSEHDVILEGEQNVVQEEIAQRIRLAQAHHERLHAAYFRAQRQPNTKYHSSIRMDPLVNQRHAQLMEEYKHVPIQKVEEQPEQNATATRPERTIVRRRERALPTIKPSVAREDAAAPISVVSKASHAPSYQELLTERKRRVEARIKSRIEDIDEMQALVPENLQTVLSIEKKGLELVSLQRALRKKAMYAMHRVLGRRGITDLRQQKISKLSRKAPLHPINITAAPHSKLVSGQRVEMSYRAQKESQRRSRRANQLQTFLNHAHEFGQSFSATNALRKRLLKDLERFFRDRSREEERRKKKQQMDRLRALRSNNEDEYLELLRTTKNKRLLQLLKQTDEYLMQIGAQVERQKQSAREQDEAEGLDKGHGAQNGTMEKAEEVKKDSEDEGDDELNRLKKRRNDYYTITHTISEKVKQPDMLIGGTLKPYQVEGLEWLVSLYNNNLNGILADEMGLGKTIQTLSLITYLMEVKKVNGPFLVIVPLSVISNWVRELNIWSPSVVKVVYKGDPATRKSIHHHQMQSGSYNVVLTTYEFIVKDKNVLGRIRWKYIIMDEGHRMKNAECKLALTLGSKYTSKNRLLLTGTPLQNNMTELWALLNFLLPSIFSSADTFETWFNAPFQASALGDSAELNEEENLLIISRLHQVLRPFMLRRLKTDVERQLPDKVENVFRCEMSVWQRVLYRQMRARLGIASGSSNVQVRSFNNMVMQLKKVCNHPYLFYNDEELMSLPRNFLTRASGKFELLDHVLRKLKRTGHRVLMFSQMTAALDYLEFFLYSVGMKYLRLDGTTKADDRQEMLEQFNAPNSEYFCFLLSTRAGGLGLNLQTADTVIIFDSDWNPMMDLQAQDRAHRIGQTKEVRVYRLICSGSVEVKILERANRKLQIDAQVIQAGQFNNKSSEGDRKEMLKDLLRQQNEDDVNNQHSTPLAEINQLLARTEEEIDVFEEVDKELEAEANGQPRLLIAESELPAWIMRPEQKAKSKTQTEAEYLLEHGRGRRKRKEVLYDDNLTEREWTLAMEAEGDVSNAVRRKRKRLQDNRGSAAGSSTGDDNRRLSSVPLTPDGEANGEFRKSSSDEVVEVEIVDVDKLESEEEPSDLQDPFLDPALTEPPKKKRKRGRPRKGTGRRAR